MNESKSKAWFERAVVRIPGGVNSPVRAFKHVGRTPIYFERAEGAYLWDVDGNQYIDFCLSFGPHLFGHSAPFVVETLRSQATKATSFGACHPKEVEMAELLVQAYPFLDKVRLVNSGTEAVMTAVRAARGFTGRTKILQFEGCYHGHSDGFLARAGSGVAELSESTSKGVPSSIVQETLTASWMNTKQWKGLFQSKGQEIAAVIFEPIPANHGLYVPDRGWLQDLMSTARQCGSLVIFDEVISGFRIGPSGACGYFDLEPDIVTLGKIIGGGLPTAAVIGKATILDQLAPVGSVYQAGTLSGNPLATAAGVEVLRKIQSSPPYPELAKRTEWFCQNLRKILSAKFDVAVTQIASLFWIQFNPTDAKTFPADISAESKKSYAEFFASLLTQGVYLPPSPYEVGFVSTEHTEPVLESALEKISRATAEIGARH